MRISDWSSDVCSSDLIVMAPTADVSVVFAVVYEIAVIAFGCRHGPMWNRGHGKVQAQTLLSRRIRPARGAFDVTYLATLPNMVVMAAADEAELVHMTYTAAEYDEDRKSTRLNSSH